MVVMSLCYFHVQTVKEEDVQVNRKQRNSDKIFIFRIFMQKICNADCRYLLWREAFKAVAQNVF